MKKKGTGLQWVLSLFLVAIAGILIGYFIGKERGAEKKAVVTEQIVPKGEKKAAGPEKKPEEKKQGAFIIETIKKPKALQLKYDCALIENELKTLCNYLNTRGYLKEVEGERDTYKRLKELSMALSSQPPIPAGEGKDDMALIQNIYYFFRILEKNNLRFIRDVFSRETDSLEFNLNLFYQWFMMGEGCPDPDKIRPSFDVLYRYAGFFMNTIGGHACLNRRSTETRLLIGYYSLLILHEADKSGKNTYGIDIFPKITPLAIEIGRYQNFHFQEEYILQLTAMQNFYLQKR